MPYGAGFSTIGSPDDLVRHKKDFKNWAKDFWTQFSLKNPKFSQGKIWIAGESYGGRWTALMGSVVADLGVGLAGVIVGVGWLDGLMNFGNFVGFAELNRNFTLVEDGELDVYKAKMELCGHLSKVGKSGFYSVHELMSCLHLGLMPLVNYIKTKNPNFSTMYMRGKNEGDFDDFGLREKFEKNLRENFFDREDVKKELGVETDFGKYRELAAYVLNRFDAADTTSPELINLLEKRVNCLIVYGDRDFLTNHLAAEKFLSNLNWRFKSQWNELKLEKCSYGFCKELSNLKYVRMEAAGHHMWASDSNRIILIDLMKEFGKSELK